MKIATWNISAGINTNDYKGEFFDKEKELMPDDRCLNAIAKAIIENDIDVIALQEVVTTESFKYMQNLSAKTGMKYYEVFLTIRPDENAYTQNLFSYAQEHNLNVIFNGPVTREDVFERYTKSVLLFPSYVESFGLPLLEARLTGSPIIAADCSFSREILKGYDKAEFFSELDYIQMGEIIYKINCRYTDI